VPTVKIISEIFTDVEKADSEAGEGGLSWWLVLGSGSWSFADCRLSILVTSPGKPEET
jgi:hypothetical protein